MHSYECVPYASLAFSSRPFAPSRFRFAIARQGCVTSRAYSPCVSPSTPLGLDSRRLFRFIVQNVQRHLVKEDRIFQVVILGIVLRIHDCDMKQ